MPPSQLNLVHLPGTTLEGGGQLLRIAVGLSALTSTPLRITDIRGNRSGGGGLKLQHLKGVQFLAQACGAPTAGSEKKSKTLQFWFQESNGMTFKRQAEILSMESIIDIGSPGSISLVFQAIFPYILFSDCSEESVHTKILGGTNVSNSPSIDYIQLVLLPMLELVGLPAISAHLHHRGWSTGRNEMGAVAFIISPLLTGSSLLAFKATGRGRIVRIDAKIITPRSTEQQAYREISRVVSTAFPDTDLELHFEDSHHPKRVYLLLVATSENGYKLGRDWLYDCKIASLEDAITKLVAKVVTDLAAEVGHGGCVDEYMRDQLAIFQALAKGRSEVDGGRDVGNSNMVEPSLHTKTAYWVAHEMLGVEFDDSGSCDGVGFVVGEKYGRRGMEKTSVAEPPDG